MKKVLKVVVNIFAWLIVIFALLVTILVFSSGRSNGVANLFGYIPLTVESQSMSPTFEQGDLIICKQVEDINTLNIDDVITFWTIIDGKKVKNTHRIVEINQAENTRSFITRGDNNPIDDDIPAYAGDIIGKWTNIRLTGAGNIMAFLRTKVGFFVCILIPMALFFLIELYKFIVTLIEVKKPETEPQLDEEEIKRRAIEEYLAAQKEKEAAENKVNTAEAKPEAEANTEKKPETASQTAEAAPAETQAPAEKTDESPAEPQKPAESEETAAQTNEASPETSAPAEEKTDETSAAAPEAADTAENASSEEQKSAE